MLSPFEWWCRNFILPDICKPCLFVFLRNLFYLTDELAHGAQKEEPVLEHLLCHLRQLSPVQRDMAVHMLHLAFRAAQELGPEE